jgi:rubrerythrin
MKPTHAKRRTFLFQSASTILSGSAIALLANKPALAMATKPSDKQVEADVRILNTALAAEREAVAAYAVGAESGLLKPGILKVAVKFQGHHKEHADVLSGTISKLGGQVDEPQAKYDFPVHKLKSQADVLSFAATLERGAVSAYAGAIPLFDNRDLAKAAASILADEAMHWSVLLGALGKDPVPGAFFS